MTTAAKSRDFNPLPLNDDKKIHEIAKRHGIPDIGPAQKAADQNAPAIERPHQLKGKLTKESYAALQRRLYEEKVKGEGVTIDCLIARGLKAIGVDIAAVDLMPDRRRK